MKKVNDLLAAIGLLTVIPVRSRTEWSDHGKLAWFPIVGLLIGLILVGIDRLGGLFLNPAGRAFVDVAVLALISGGLHIDGLADAADGLWAHRGRERALEIMKDSRIGVFGVIAVVLVLAAKWIGITSLHPGFRTIYLLWVPVFGRTALLTGLACGRPARTEESMARDLFMKEPGCLPALAALAVLAVPMFFNFRLGMGMALLWAAAVTAWLGFCRRRLGGMTGDTLGALNELIEALLLFTGCLI